MNVQAICSTALNSAIEGLKTQFTNTVNTCSSGWFSPAAPLGCVNTAINAFVQGSSQAMAQYTTCLLGQNSETITDSVTQRIGQTIFIGMIGFGIFLLVKANQARPEEQANPAANPARPAGQGNQAPANQAAIPARPADADEDPFANDAKGDQVDDEDPFANDAKRNPVDDANPFDSL